MHDLAVAALEAPRLPAVHPRPDLVDRVPAEDRRQRRDRLQARAAVEAVRPLDVPGGAALADQPPVRQRLREVGAGEPEPRARAEAGLHLGEQPGREADVRVELHRDVPRLRDALEAPGERPPLVRADHPVALARPAGAGEHGHVRVRPREPPRDQRRPVGGAVVDEHEPVGRAPLGGQRVEQHGQVLRLVEERDDDGDAQAGGHRRTPQTPSFWRSTASVTRGWRAICLPCGAHAVRDADVVEDDDRPAGERPEHGGEVVERGLPVVVAVDAGVAQRPAALEHRGQRLPERARDHLHPADPEPREVVAGERGQRSGAFDRDQASPAVRLERRALVGGRQAQRRRPAPARTRAPTPARGGTAGAPRRAPCTSRGRSRRPCGRRRPRGDRSRRRAAPRRRRRSPGARRRRPRRRARGAAPRSAASGRCRDARPPPPARAARRGRPSRRGRAGRRSHGPSAAGRRAPASAAPVSASALMRPSPDGARRARPMRRRIRRSWSRRTYSRTSGSARGARRSAAQAQPAR